MEDKLNLEVVTSVNGDVKIEELNKKIDTLGNEAKETGKEVDNLEEQA